MLWRVYAALLSVLVMGHADIPNFAINQGIFSDISNQQ